MFKEVNKKIMQKNNQESSEENLKDFFVRLDKLMKRLDSEQEN